MNLHIEIDREDDGRWIAEVPEIPGVMVYGSSELEAIRKVKSLALTVLADQIAHGEFDGFDSIAFAKNQAA